MAYNNNNHNGGSWLPPHLRSNAPNPEVRPESSVSNATFASQIQMPTFTSRITNPAMPQPQRRVTRQLYGDDNETMPPNGWSFGPGNFTNDIPPYDHNDDPFTVNQNHNLLRSHPTVRSNMNMLHFGSQQSGSTAIEPGLGGGVSGAHAFQGNMRMPQGFNTYMPQHNPTNMPHSHMTAMPQNNAPFNIPFDNTHHPFNNNSRSNYVHGSNNAFVNNSINHAYNSDRSYAQGANAYNSNRSYPQPASDSTIPSARSNYLANLIMNGCADDPTDIDFGNPGRSKRLPPEPPNNPMLTLPAPRGNVAAGNHENMNADNFKPNIKGTSIAYLGTDFKAVPAWFSYLDNGYKPTVKEVFHDLPIMDACTASGPSTAGVIKIEGFPYGTTRSEITAFLGKNAQILTQPEGSPYHAVHILMDRYSGKTMDAFIEVATPLEAKFVVDGFARRVQVGRHVKLGDRDVVVSQVTQGDLMAALFNRPKMVTWDGGKPLLSKINEEFWPDRPGFPGARTVGFQGFMLDEELTLVYKFAETPQRSPFVSRNLVRTYEHLITILHKYPWYATEHVLIKEREAIYQTTFNVIRALIVMLQKPKDAAKAVLCGMPTTATLQELIVAALTCPGFTEGMKATIVREVWDKGHRALVSSRGMNIRFGGVGKFACDFPFYGLVPNPHAQDIMIQYVASLLNDASLGSENLSIADLHAMDTSMIKPSIFGKFTADYSHFRTLADLITAEFRSIDKHLARVLPRGSRSSTTGSTQTGSRSGHNGLLSGPTSFLSSHTSRRS